MISEQGGKKNCVDSLTGAVNLGDQNFPRAGAPDAGGRYGIGMASSLATAGKIIAARAEPYESHCTIDAPTLA